MKRVKRIRSHAGHARFLAECSETGRTVPSSVRSPYHFTDRVAVYRYRGLDVIVVETAHRRFDVFAVEKEK